MLNNPKPFLWTASIDSILAKIGRCKAVLEKVHERSPPCNTRAARLTRGLARARVIVLEKSAPLVAESFWLA
jgi:hypothetical protein